MEIEETAASPVAEETVAPVAEPVTSGQGADTEGESEGETSLADDLEQYLDDGTGDGSPETVEIEHEGKTYKVPPELKDGFLRHKDYTQKTMSLAEERKAVEAAKADAEAIRSISGEKLQAVVAAQQAHAKVEQLLQTPIDGLTQDQINSLRLDLTDAQAAVAHWATKANEAGSKEQQALDQHFAKAREDAVREAAKHIPNFTDTRRTELDSFVQKLGGKAGAVAELADPLAWQLVHFAEIGAKVLERQRQAKKATAAQSVQPAAEVGGSKSPATAKDPEKMSPEEWTRWREADLAKKRAR